MALIRRARSTSASISLRHESFDPREFDRISAVKLLLMISGDLLREARLRAGLSQAELARRACKATSVIGRWERGEVRPSLETLSEVIRAAGLELGVTLSNADTDGHDVALIRQALGRTPAERFAHGQQAARKLREVWGAAKPVARG
jgi:transcriptional regulator with XRE-family HTH domain